MIDLYRRLGARGPSDTAQIERAMAYTDSWITTQEHQGE
jgi:hypothetical protein